MACQDRSITVMAVWRYRQAALIMWRAQSDESGHPQEVILLIQRSAFSQAIDESTGSRMCPVQ
jgi:hypothetical protein